MTFLLTHWRYAALAVLLAFGALQTVRLRAAQSDARALRVEIGQYRAAYDALATSAQRQSAAVTEWQATAERAAQAGRRARAEAAEIVRQQQSRADALAAAVAAAAGAPGDVLTCSAGLEVVRADLAR